ncbi:hypothetical protein CFP56_012741 [Quercus suber]|uniref:PORR domain-containing protein n=1 Tax=Quercus suber TaxID=58331 RepID=A0AAW0KUW1_QUESU
MSTKIGTCTVVLKEGYKRGLLVEDHPWMQMRNRYIHLMSMVKEYGKPVSVLGGSNEKKRQTMETSMGNGVVHYGSEFYSDDDLKSWALVSSFEALMSPFPPHHRFIAQCLLKLSSGNHLFAKYLKLNHMKLWGFDPEALLNMEECKAWEVAAIRDQDIVNTLTSLVGLGFIAKYANCGEDLCLIPESPFYLEGAGGEFGN